MRTAALLALLVVTACTVEDDPRGPRVGDFRVGPIEVHTNGMPSTPSQVRSDLYATLASWAAGLDAEGIDCELEALLETTWLDYTDGPAYVTPEGWRMSGRIEPRSWGWHVLVNWHVDAPVLGHEIGHAVAHVCLGAPIESHAEMERFADLYGTPF
jgi:hypothetical protein